ncbi:MAG TPA: class II aldolase/adducin family protein [Caulobacteraceae bacterium]|jgi:ribulose-5-phosphate 4-epimerase/fuculose-1-phosphate aldolase|nr:class II aldolase/adducin family protein [Caulobacteraceae bacterium]
MADGSLATLKDKVSEAEWKTRVDLAALYRLVALHDWDEAIFTHISARIPGEENRFLINPYGLFFDEMRASDLVKVDLEGGIAQETQAFINPAGFTIHSAIHAAREDAHWVMHLHTVQGTAVAAQKEGLLPLTQTGMVVRPQVAYHDYEGIALNLDERERLVADLGDKTLMILRNHGTLAVGSTPGECWMAMFYLERACEAQALALSGGRDGVLIAPQSAQEEVKAQAAAVPWVANLAWPGWRRRLDRLSPGYDA